MWSRINLDADGMMPPRDSKKQLSAAQKETLRLWIEQGAKYQKHWSFESISRPRAPEIRNPKLEIRNPIDAFLLDRLNRAGQKATAEADRETLVRRVAFALTGVPPTIKEVDEFLADKSANAYEKMVDHFLASARFGEEMARNWLDVARYADTHGLHLDNERLMWKYRDWVVKAFNENLPFDKFTVYQLAGDLLPNPTHDQLAATGFNRCNVTTGEVAPSTRSGSTATRSIAPAPRSRRGSGSPPAAQSATTTSSIRFRRRSSTRSTRSSTAPRTRHSTATSARRGRS